MALQIDEQPAATDFWRKAATMPSPPAKSAPLGAGWLRRLFFDAWSGGLGFVEGDRAEWASQCAELDALLPATRTLIVLDTQRQLFNNHDLLAPSQTAVTTDPVGLPRRFGGNALLSRKFNKETHYETAKDSGDRCDR